MSINAHQKEFTKNVAKLINFAFDNCIELTFGEAYRTQAQQTIYYNTGKTKTMNSNHMRRLAVDFNFFVDGRLTYDFEAVKILGDYWCSLHPKNRWGGDFNKDGIKNGFVDTPHFEMNV